MKSLFVLRVLLIISFVAGAVLVSPGTVNAASLSEPQIQSILNLLQVFGADSSAVQNVEKALRGESTSAAPQETRFCYSFTRNFGVGTMGADVRALAQALQKEGVYSGQITSTFTEPLASAVVEFQEKYQQDVLGPWGLTRGTGFMGGTTRAKLNALYGCGVAQVSSPTPIPIPSPTPPVTSVVAPVITSISPNSASQGVDRANMTIFGRNFTGAGTQSGCGLSNVFNNQGFQIVSCKVVSDTLISAQFTVADDATPGVRAINLSTPTGGGSNKVNFTVVAKTSVPSITVLSPNGGEKFTIGSPITIKWQNTNYRESIVNIALYKSDTIPGNAGYNFVAQIGALGQQPNDEVEVWTIPSTVSPGANYFVRVTLDVQNPQSGLDMVDDSNGPFSIVKATETPYPSGPAPEMVYPANGQALNYGSPNSYPFKVKPVEGARGYLFGFFQNGVMIYENWRDDKVLSANGEFSIWPSNSFYSKFKEGDVQVWVRALINNQWTEARIITIKLVSATTVTSSDSDSSPDYTGGVPSYPITQEKYPDLFIAGVGKGDYLGGGPCIYGPEPFCKSTSDTFTTFYDHCATPTQLNEAFLTSNGRLGAAGIRPPSGYECRAGAFVPATTLTPSITSITGPTSVIAGQSVEYSFAATEQSGASSLDFFIVWGDGTPGGEDCIASSAVKESQEGIQTFTCSAEHTFAQVGTYTMKVIASPTNVASWSSEKRLSVEVSSSGPSIIAFNYTETDAYDGSIKFYWTNSGTDSVNLWVPCYSGLTIKNAATGVSFLCGESDLNLPSNSSMYLKFTNTSGASVNVTATLTPIAGNIVYGTSSKTLNFTIVGE